MTMERIARVLVGHSRVVLAATAVVSLVAVQFNIVLGILLVFVSNYVLLTDSALVRCRGGAGGRGRR